MDKFIHKQSVSCKYCNSANIVKYGTFEGMQRYFCKSCERKFADNDALPKMKTPIWIITIALNCYYSGMSLGAIQREINQRHGAYYAQSSIYNWVVRFSKSAIEQADSFKPDTGDEWLFLTTPLKSENRKIWFWDIFDMNSSFLLASRLCEINTNQEAIRFINSTLLTVNTPNRTITIILSENASDIDAIRNSGNLNLQKEVNFNKAGENVTAQFLELLKKRNKVVHSFRNMETAQILNDTWRLYYNFISENEKLGRTTPVHKMGKTPFKNWTDIIQSLKNKQIS